ncbi:hypothetical protein ACFL0M_16205 [Thermodesulfobacteriota bacterium]
MSIHPLEAMTQDHISMNLIDTGVQHISFYSPAYIVEDDTVLFFSAIRDLDIITSCFKGSFYSAFSYNGTALVSDYILMRQ